MIPVMTDDCKYLLSMFLINKSVRSLFYSTMFSSVLNYLPANNPVPIANNISQRLAEVATNSLPKTALKPV